MWKEGSGLHHDTEGPDLQLTLAALVKLLQGRNRAWPDVVKEVVDRAL